MTTGKWKLNPETGTFIKVPPPKRSLPDGTPFSRVPEYRRLSHQQKYRDDEEYRTRVQEQERNRQRARKLLTLPLTLPGPCEICGATTNGVNRKTGSNRSMSADHDHATGLFRGWLCNGCNTGIGMFSDSPDLLREAIRYLDAHAASHNRRAEEA